ncbi:hypothetical protein B0H67DRAFT_640173 [Lasiosphaeris hirsuta]|uniref:Uncharacterized protein n=1 Tax=Lasiosphaeris hirsuta TaxID=260670 RepID=A0AA40BCP2_9PEZI|nr:hypothetical protein B0H67DRAFT_640173 [Lasiosphaeris hirsuta]
MAYCVWSKTIACISSSSRLVDDAIWEISERRRTVDPPSKEAARGPAIHRPPPVVEIETPQWLGNNTSGRLAQDKNPGPKRLRRAWASHEEKKLMRPLSATWETCVLPKNPWRSLQASISGIAAKAGIHKIEGEEIRDRERQGETRSIRVSGFEMAFWNPFRTTRRFVLSSVFA